MTAQQRLHYRRSGPFHGFAGVFGGLVSLAAVALAAVLAVFFAATVVVVAVLASALLGLAGLVMRNRRRPARRRTDDGVLEARNIGGHSWVAYGWNEQPR